MQVPRGAVIALLFCLSSAAAWRHEVAPAAPSESAYPLAVSLRWALGAAFPYAVLVFPIVLAAAAYAWARRTTGNPGLALATGAIVAGLPTLGPLIGAPPGWPVLLSSTLVLLHFVARERALETVRCGGSPRRGEGLAFGAFLAALCAGPSGFLVPLFVPVVTGIFQRESGIYTLKRRIPLFLLYGVVGGLSVLIVQPWRHAGEVLGFDPLFDLLPVRWALTTDDWRSALVLAAGAIGCPLVIYAVRTVRTRPRWILIHLGFAAYGVFAGHVLSALGLLTLGAGTILGALGLALAIPAMIWRVLSAVRFPEVRLARRSVPPSVRGADIAEDPIGASDSPTSSERERLVRVAVEAAVGESWRLFRNERATRCAPEREELWRSYERAARVRVSARVSRVVADDREAMETDRWNFETRIDPWIHPNATFLDLMPERPFLSLLAARRVERALLIHDDRDHLRDLLQLQNEENETFGVVADPLHLEGLAPASVDFVHTSVFRRLDQEDAFLLLESLWRLLRPKGRGLFVFADLGDPTGFAAFRSGIPAVRLDRSQRINYVTADLVRTLVEHAGFVIDELELGRTGQDLLVSVERSP